MEDLISTEDDRYRRYVLIDDVPMAYVDVGMGDPIIFLHGNPTPSYLWRKIIPYTLPFGRCLAPDYPGMGNSGPTPDGRYCVFDQQRYLDGWLETLGLRDNIILVLHDWGSALGFDWARRHPAAVKAIIYMEGIVWPDDARTWDRVLPVLHAANLRTIVPYLRGFGPTRFRDPGTLRSGQISALAKDVLELAEALGLPRYAVIGHDWGARAAYVASCLTGPEHISHCAALSVGWGTNDPGQTLSLPQIQNYWYHWYLSLERGARLVREDRRSFTRYIWSIWNPGWEVSESEFEATAASFDNPDWADVVLHSTGHAGGLHPLIRHSANWKRVLAAFRRSMYRPW